MLTASKSLWYVDSTGTFQSTRALSFLEVSIYHTPDFCHFLHTSVLRSHYWKIHDHVQSWHEASLSLRDVTCLGPGAGLHRLKQELPQMNPQMGLLTKALKPERTEGGCRLKASIGKGQWSKASVEPEPYQCWKAEHLLMKALITKRFRSNSSYVKCLFHGV